MATSDPRFDAYIKKANPFARPILEHLRAVVRAACPGVEETMKWSSPFFMYHGAILCHMAAFKEHCIFGFWKHAIILPDGTDANAAAGQFGRITSVKELPSKKELTGYIKQAMALNAAGVKPQAAKAAPKAPIPVPADFKRALAADKKAQKAFDAFSPSQRREYLEWITEAKTDATRERRMATALEWIAEGKSRHWKYQNC